MRSDRILRYRRSALRWGQAAAPESRPPGQISREEFSRLVAECPEEGAHDVDLPLGNHRITLSIADTAGGSASRTFSLSVAR